MNDRRRTLYGALAGLAGVVICSAAYAVDGHGSRSVSIHGVRYEFALDDLIRAEERIRAASPAGLDEVLDSLSPTLRTVALWDMSQISEETVTTGVARVRPPCNDVDCGEGVPSDPEPPADPPPTVRTTLPPPPPQPTCYVREDVRTAKSGTIVKATAYKYHQHLEYCVVGQLVQPGSPLLYSYYSHIEALWTCQPAEFDRNLVTTPGGNLVVAHSSGRCWWSIGVTLGGRGFSAEAGRTNPNITDTYGIDGSRITRSGSSY